jgi:hypothetical protein
MGNKLGSWLILMSIVDILNDIPEVHLPEKSTVFRSVVVVNGAFMRA